MTERPILFSAPMVRAILDGRKTQTRRVVTLSTSTVLGYTGRTGRNLWDTLDWQRVRVDGPNGLDAPGNHYLHVGAPDEAWYRVRCRINTGDALWVREAFYEEVVEDERWVAYRATNVYGDGGLKWRPSIFMPRWASRITLDVTGVRVERVQDISEDDAKAEGIQDLRNGTFDAGESWMGPNARHAFMRGWDSINAKRGFGWDANPWVWVVDFTVRKQAT